MDARAAGDYYRHYGRRSNSSRCGAVHGTEYLLVFEGDESVELRDDELAVGPVLMWSRHDDGELATTSAPGDTGYAASGDIVAIDLSFDPDQIWDWKTRPYPECERDDIALVVSE